MPVRVSLELLRVGHCRHCERMVRADGHWHAVEFPALSVLIRHPQRGALLYDTGYAAHFFVPPIAGPSACIAGPRQ